jgi:hypothetical protein
MENKSFLIGGKLGDFIHGLVVCKYVYEQTQTPVNVYIANIGDLFDYDLEFTFLELQPILKKQKWLNDFDFFTTQKIDYNISLFRQSKHLYNTNWNNIYFKTFLDGVETPQEYHWLEFDKDASLQHTLVINRSLFPKNDDAVLEKYLEFFKEYKEVVFVCFNAEQYQLFPLKDYTKMYQVQTLSEMFKVINSCKCFIGDLTGTFAIATALNVPRKLEISSCLDRSRDAIHYIDDTQYYKHFTYF